MVQHLCPQINYTKDTSVVMSQEQPGWGRHEGSSSGKDQSDKNSTWKKKQILPSLPLIEDTKQLLNTSTNCTV